MFVNDFSPVMLEVGPLEVRWYGLLFAVGIVLNYLILRWIFKREKYNLDDLDSVVFYLFVGMVLGARLGQVFFYDPSYYFSDPVEILKIWKGGLSSHGATIGLFVAYFVWGLVKKVKFSKYVDAIVLGVPLTAGFVRIGNFFNSEIIGLPTGGEWGIVFAKLGEDFARHPVQLYEAGIAFLIFGFLILVYKKFYKKTPRMFFLFLFMLTYFVTRFFVEFLKDRHGLLEEFSLSLGQVLSVLPVLIAILYFAIIYSRQKKRTN